VASLGAIDCIPLLLHVVNVHYRGFGGAGALGEPHVYQGAYVGHRQRRGWFPQLAALPNQKQGREDGGGDATLPSRAPHRGPGRIRFGLLGSLSQPASTCHFLSPISGAGVLLVRQTAAASVPASRPGCAAPPARPRPWAATSSTRPTMILINLYFACGPVFGLSHR
jgi:hypothetical protein